METNLTLTAEMHAELWEKPPEILYVSDVNRDKSSISKSFITTSMFLQIAMGVY